MLTNLLNQGWNVGLFCDFGHARYYSGPHKDGISASKDTDE